MKRGGPLRRRTALRPGGPLVRRTPLRAVAGRQSVRPPATAAERLGRRVVRARSGGLCEACGMRRAVEWHHRRNRSQQGTWDPANGLHVCRQCHAWITNNPYGARAHGWSVLSHEDPAVVPLLRRADAWVVLGGDGAVLPVERYTGGPWQCLSWSREGGLRCALGVLHEGDHECGLTRWSATSEEKAHG